MPIFDIKNFGLVLKPLRSVGVGGGGFAARLRRSAFGARVGTLMPYPVSEGGLMPFSPLFSTKKTWLARGTEVAKGNTRVFGHLGLSTEYRAGTPLLGY